MEDGNSQWFGRELGVERAALLHLRWGEIGAVGEVQMSRLGRVFCRDLAFFFMAGAALNREKSLGFRVGEVNVDVHDDCG